MTREQKIAKRKERAKRRADKRAKKYRDFLNANRDLINHGGFSASKQGVWFDSSRGKFMQKCSYYGLCESPCNGDC